MIDIRTRALVGGDLPGRALGMVVEWATAHADELLELWERARANEPLTKLDPLS